MKISRLRIYQVDLPLDKPYALSGGRLHYSALDSTIVVIETDQGLSGIGESCPWGSSYLPAFARGVRAGLAELAPHLLGCNPLNLNAINQVMDLALPGHPYVKTAVDMACWDILGRYCNLPVHTLLGGRLNTELTLQSSIPTSTPRQMVVDMHQAHAEGYRIHSCKVGSGVSADLSRIQSLLADRVRGDHLTFDANRAWLPAQAIAVMNAVKDPEVHFEQPCQTLEQCQHVRRLTHQPLILDECIHDAGDLYRACARHTAQVIGLKIARVGGLTKARHLRDYCIERGIQMNIEDVGGSQIADTAAMHLAMATPHQYLRASWNACRHHSIVTAHGGVSVSRGIARLDDSPGLGLTLCPQTLGDAVAVHE